MAYSLDLCQHCGLEQCRQAHISSDATQPVDGLIYGTAKGLTRVLVPQRRMNTATIVFGLLNYP